MHKVTKPLRRAQWLAAVHPRVEWSCSTAVIATAFMRFTASLCVLVIGYVSQDSQVQLGQVGTLRWVAVGEHLFPLPIIFPEAVYGGGEPCESEENRYLWDPGWWEGEAMSMGRISELNLFPASKGKHIVDHIPVHHPPSLFLVAYHQRQCEMDTALVPLLSSTSSPIQDLTDTICNVTLRYIGPFNFVLLYGFLQEILQNVTDPQQCPYLKTENGIVSLPNEVCRIVTGSNKWTWWMYSLIGVWSRIVCFSSLLFCLGLCWLGPWLTSV